MRQDTQSHKTHNFHWTLVWMVSSTDWGQHVGTLGGHNSISWLFNVDSLTCCKRVRQKNELSLSPFTTRSMQCSPVWGQSAPQKRPSMTCSTCYGRQHPWRVALSPLPAKKSGKQPPRVMTHLRRKENNQAKKWGRGLGSWLDSHQNLDNPRFPRM